MGELNEVKLLDVTKLMEEQLKEIEALVNKYTAKNSRIEIDVDYRDGYTIDSDEYDEERIIKIQRTEFTSAPYVQLCAEIGLYRSDRQEVEDLAEKLCTKEQLRRWSLQCEVPLQLEETSQLKFNIMYDADSEEIRITSTYTAIVDTIYFTDHQVLVQAIEAIGKPRLTHMLLH